jgi:hypothetical protein
MQRDFNPAIRVSQSLVSGFRTICCPCPRVIDDGAHEAVADGYNSIETSLTVKGVKQDGVRGVLNSSLCAKRHLLVRKWI